MLTMFHGIDRHEKYSTISVLNRKGEEIRFTPRCTDLKGYIDSLGPEDAVVMEACSGAFYWADRIETRGAACSIIDPHRFRIIKDSWNKTDTHDARNMAQALWVSVVTGKYGIPTVYKPTMVIREMRKLYSQYQMLNRQIRVLKNSLQAILTENGIHLTGAEKNRLLSVRHGKEIVRGLELTHASEVNVRISLDLLWRIEEEKGRIKKEILLTGEPLHEAVKLLITIKGITPLVALAFLADVGDIERFPTLRKMNAYLGLVPRVKESGGKSRHGHITRESRKLTRTLLTQSVYHISNASPVFRKYYSDLKERRGVGRARIALIRKVCGVMRRMLITGECFRWMKDELFVKKLRAYEKELESLKREKKVA